MSVLKSCVEMIELYRNVVGLEYEELNLILIDMCFKQIYDSKTTDLLFLVSDNEPEYKAFMKKLLGENADKILKDLGEDQQDVANDLVLKFSEVSIRAVFNGLTELLEKQRHVLPENFIKHFGKIKYYNNIPYDSGYVVKVTDEITDVGDIYNDVMRVLDGINDEIATESIDIPDDKKYISQLMQQGFVVIKDNESFLGKTNMKGKILDWLNFFAKQVRLGNYPNQTCYSMADFLEAEGVNPKNADIWSPNIYTLCEDLQFRVFLREDDISHTLLIKLPVGLDDFVFDKANSEGRMKMLPNLFTTKEYSSTVISKPRICSLKGTRKVDCTYYAIEVILCKDLLGFKKSDWLLRDYIRACKGEKNAFSQFRNLALGSRIVVGAMPGALKAEIFDCSGKYQTSGMIGGGAGSGKTAMFDNLLVQSLALQGDYGNGAVILIDAKQEWIPAWQSVFNQFNVPFYGFDGSLVQSECKWVVNKKGTKTIEVIPFSVTKAVAGVIFTRTLYEFIQHIQKEGCNAGDISEYNKSNIDYKGITRIPRTSILCDEINTFYTNTESVPELKKTFKLMTEAANLTRTSGYMWLLGGQNPTKTIVSSIAVGSLGYNIFGTMSDETYEYFKVNQNEEVKKYEAINANDEVKHPIMSQGMFYAGPKGSCDLVKCLYLPTSERADSLGDLGGIFPGMEELHKIVKLALDMKFFDNYTFGFDKKNNVIYAVLRDIGVLTNEEFTRHSERVLGESADTDEYTDDSSDIDAMQSQVGDENSSQTPVFTPHNNDNNHQTNQGKDDTFVGIKTSPIIPSRDEDSNNSDNIQDNNSWGNEASDGFDTNSNVGQFERTIESDRKQSVNNYNEPNEHRCELKPNQDIINMCATDNINKVYAINQLSKLLITQIDKDFGIDRIHTFEVVGDGFIKINGVMYKPFLPNMVMDCLPIDLQRALKQGQIIELFNFIHLYKFRNLEVLSIDNPRLAEGRLRRELGLKPQHDWLVVFKKFKNLNKIIIAGIDVTDAESSEKYQSNFSKGFSLGESLVNKLFGGKDKGSRGSSSNDGYRSNSMNPLIHTGSGILGTMQKSRTCRVATKALGYTVGLKAVTLAASIFGPWGVVFGAMAVYGTVTQAKKNGGLFADSHDSMGGINPGQGYTNRMYEEGPKEKKQSRKKKEI